MDIVHILRRAVSSISLPVVQVASPCHGLFEAAIIMSMAKDHGRDNLPPGRGYP
jgi:hypothetical protein